VFVLLRLIINAVALLVTAWIVPGIHLGAASPHPTQHDWVTLPIVALIFGVIILLSLPLEIITPGLFTFVINAFMLLLTSWIAQGMGLGFLRLDGFTWHGNRHTFASRLAMAGTELLTIKEVGGWKSLAMVQRYAHLTPNRLREAVERLVTNGATELARN
jgi:putative membrane protein